MNVDRPLKHNVGIRRRRVLPEYLQKRLATVAARKDVCKKKNKISQSCHVGRFEAGQVKSSPEVRTKLSGIHTTRDKEIRFCVFGHPTRTSDSIMASRIRPTPVPSVPKPAPAPPAGRGNELWQKLYISALKSGHPDPEKMADTVLRVREKSLALMASRPKLLITKEVPKHEDLATVPKKTRDIIRCKAQTLEGRQCGFKATCGHFCRKHNPV